MTTEGFDPYIEIEKLRDQFPKPAPDVDALLNQLHERHEALRIYVGDGRIEVWNVDVLYAHETLSLLGQGSSLREAIQDALEATP